MRKFRYYPKEKKQDYSKLFTGEEQAKLQYIGNSDFRTFVNEHTGASLAELHEVYTKGGLQLSLF